MEFAEVLPFWRRRKVRQKGKWRAFVSGMSNSVRLFSAFGGFMVNVGFDRLICRQVYSQIEWENGAVCG